MNLFFQNLHTRSFAFCRGGLAALCLCCMEMLTAEEFPCRFFQEPEAFRSIMMNAVIEAEQGPSGLPAIKATMPGMLQRMIQPEKLWDNSTGIQFQVKGDGSDYWGCISLRCGSQAWNYCYFFPLKNPQWQQYTVAWEDFTNMGNFTLPINASGAPRPSEIDQICIGDRFRLWFRGYLVKPFSYALADFKFVTTAQTPLEADRYPAASYTDFLRKLKDGSPLTIVAVGDSITAASGLGNNAYPERVGILLGQHFGNSITVRNCGIGGASVRESIAWVRRDLAEPCDLVTMSIGFNDKSAAMHPEVFRCKLGDWIEQVNAVAKGKTAILLIPTLPGSGFRLTRQEEYAAVCREVAAAFKLPVCEAGEAIKDMSDEERKASFFDVAHPNAKGHIRIADYIANAIIQDCRKLE